MIFRRLCFSLTKSNIHSPPFNRKITSHFPIFNSVPTFHIQYCFNPNRSEKLCAASRLVYFSSQMGDARRPFTVPIPDLDKANKTEILRALETTLGSPFSVDPICPVQSPLIIVISGPSGVGKDAVIKKLREVRAGLHFVVTATSRPMRPGEVHGKDYYFVSKEEFLSMVQQDELLEYALVYGDYKGIPKQQIREFMAKGDDIVLRVDIQGAKTLRRILGSSAVFIFLVAESELALVQRLIDRKTETKEELLVRITTAREEVKHMKNFDYVVVNEEGKLENAVKMVESIIDAEKAKVHQRRAVI